MTATWARTPGAYSAREVIGDACASGGRDHHAASLFDMARELLSLGGETTVVPER
jgi:hypothetical protein